MRWATPVITSIILAVIAFVLWTNVISPELNDNYLDQNGINGTAKILDAEQTQVFVNNNPQIQFELLVNVSGKAPYKANYTTVVPMVDLAKFQPGDKYYVLVDPKNPLNVKFA